jgi:hypothetical protein
MISQARRSRVAKAPFCRVPAFRALDNYGNVTNTVMTVTDNDPGSPYNGDTWATNTTNTTDISVNPTTDLAA